MPVSSSRSTSWATTARPRLSVSLANPAGATGTRSASRCTTACGRTTWTVARARDGSPARGSGGAGVRRLT
eukprot:2259843-Alexandrium_andersonii.AAC.1